MEMSTQVEVVTTRGTIGRRDMTYTVNEHIAGKVEVWNVHPVYDELIFFNR